MRFSRQPSPDPSRKGLATLSGFFPKKSPGPSRIHREGICAPLVAEDAKRELAIREKWKAQDEEAWDEARSLEENLNSLLFRAIQAKNVRQAKSLLLDGANPDARDFGKASKSNGARLIAMGGLSGK